MSNITRAGMNCLKCGMPTRVIAKPAAKSRLRECAQGHRAETVEVFVQPVSEPATRGTVLAMRADGRSIRDIADALFMSTATVQRHLAGASRAPALQAVVSSWVSA